MIDNLTAIIPTHGSDRLQQSFKTANMLANDMRVVLYFDGPPYLPKSTPIHKNLCIINGEDNFYDI